MPKNKLLINAVLCQYFGIIKYYYYYMNNKSCGREVASNIILWLKENYNYRTM